MNKNKKANQQNYNYISHFYLQNIPDIIILSLRINYKNSDTFSFQKYPTKTFDILGHHVIIVPMQAAIAAIAAQRQDFLANSLEFSAETHAFSIMFIFR